jgi:hypothetical protein
LVTITSTGGGFCRHKSSSSRSGWVRHKVYHNSGMAASFQGCNRTTVVKIVLRLMMQEKGPKPCTV